MVRVYSEEVGFVLFEGFMVPPVGVRWGGVCTVHHGGLIDIEIS